jgi:hypothetical protein
VDSLPSDGRTFPDLQQEESIPHETRVENDVGSRYGRSGTLAEMTAIRLTFFSAEAGGQTVSRMAATAGRPDVIANGKPDRGLDNAEVNPA